MSPHRECRKLADMKRAFMLIELLAIVGSHLFRRAAIGIAVTPDRAAGFRHISSKAPVRRIARRIFPGAIP